MLLQIAVSLCLLTVVFPYPWFPLEIPNGDKVPHPCWPNTIWKGVGHKKMEGGGDRNPFGMDFMKAGFKWTKTLCELDSDEDGVTNGEELGDPSCVWKKGDTPEAPASGHPGVCDDVDASGCMTKNKWKVCDQKVFSCNGIKEPGVTTFNLTFPKTPVPGDETNYFCMLFELPSDKDYHIVADQPIIDNSYTIHHMLLYACPPSLSEADISELKKHYGQPARCGMLAQSTCGSTIGGWTVGGVGDCFDDIDAGTRIGKTSYKYAILEMHWNNPEHKTGWEDASGMKFHLTENLRTHDLGVLAVGQMALKIPPNTNAYEQEATCSSRCTEEQLGDTSIYIVSAGLHMHYNGSKGYLDLYRNNKHIASLAADEPFIYDSPVDHNHDPVIEVRPGDELRTRCIFNTSGRNEHVYYGDATSDEMCFAYISYYPKTPTTAFDYCVHFGSAELCNKEELEFVGDCKTGGFDGADLWKELTALGDICDSTGVKCRSACKKLLTENGTYPCLKGDARMYIETVLPVIEEVGADLLRAFRSCDAEIYLESLESGINSGVHVTGSVVGPLGWCVISALIRLFAD